MASTSNIVWTTVPHGARFVTGNAGQVVRLSASLLVSPRLTADTPETTLAAFADDVAGAALLDWPGRVGTMEFVMQVAGGAQFPSAVDPGTSDVRSTPAWTSIFTPQTLVRSHTPDDHSASPVWTDGESALVETMRDLYRRVVSGSPRQPPTVATLRSDDAIEQLGQAALEHFEAQRSDLAERLREHRFVDHNTLASSSHQIAWNQNFKGGATTEASLEPIEALPEPDEYDFHQMISAASAHPILMRVLGLIRDVIVDVPVDQLPTGAQQVRILPVDDQWSLGIRQPFTAVVIDRDRFIAQPKTLAATGAPFTPGGWMRWGDTTRFTPVTFDVDGAASKLLNLLQGDLAGKPATSTQPDPSAEPAALAALRSNGISIADGGRAADLVDALGDVVGIDAALTAASGDPVVYAEHLRRGVRVDVRDDDNGLWSSLMRRVGTIEVGGSAGSAGVTGLPPVDDEGVVTVSPTIADENGVEVIKLPESPFLWDGWSLVTPRPGSGVAQPTGAVAGPGGGPRIAEETNEPRPALDVNVSVSSPKGSLPVLRFGRSYTLRARLADVTGGGPALDDSADEADTMTDSISYLRMEPVASPIVLLRDPPGEGENVDRLVIRTWWRNEVTEEVARRHLAPPTVSVGFAERHGRIDRLVNGRLGPDPAEYAPMQDRDRGGYGARDVDFNSEASVDPLHEAVALPATAGAGYFYDTDSLTVDYLPDPLGPGMTFQGVPRSPDPLHVEFAPPGADDQWPDWTTARLELRGGPGATHDASDPKRLVVVLAKSDIVDITLSCHLGDGDDNLFGILDWIAADQSLREQARAGLLWPVTPFRRLRLIHAVKQPLIDPDLDPDLFGVERDPASTSARLYGDVAIHRPSTAKVDLYADWTDRVDDPAVTITAETDFDRSVSHLPVVSVDQQDLLDGPAGRATFPEFDHEFGDTRHRRVTYVPIAVSPFAEYFVEHTTVAAATIEADPMFVFPQQVVAGSVRVARLPDRVELTAGTEFAVDPDGLSVEILAEAHQGSDVDIAFITRPIAVSGSTVTASIPSSTRPAPPVIDTILPAFGWSEPAADRPATIVSERRSRCLRVYLARPWYLSGAGEQLAVVLWQEPGAVETVFADEPPPPIKRIRQQVTHWARDPLFTGGRLPSSWPTLQSFPLRTGESSTDLRVPGLAGDPVIAVGHQPQFDVSSQRWFCDIEFDSGLAYAPFVRLALARFQPESVSGLELSSVVLADYAQLAPDRSCAITREPGRGGRVSISLTGPDGVSSAGAGVATAVAERLRRAGGDMDWEQVGRPVELERTESTQTPGLVVWSGSLTIPTRLRTRLVIEQAEQYHSTVDGVIDRRVVHRDVIDV